MQHRLLPMSLDDQGVQVLGPPQRPLPKLPPGQRSGCDHAVGHRVLSRVLAGNLAKAEMAR